MTLWDGVNESGDGANMDMVKDMNMDIDLDMTEKYRILFSTAGYYPAQTKRALVRSIDPAKPELLDTSRCEGTLYRDDIAVWAENLTYKGLTFGIELWELDFSTVKDPGCYRLEIQLTDKNEMTGKMTSLDFPIGDWLISEQVLKGLSIYNAESRYATSTDKGGYYDCNTEMGESFSHGRFLYGLADYMKMRGASLNTWERVRLRRAMDCAFDYLYFLWREDGEIAHSWPTRFQAEANPGIHNSYWSVMGLLAHMELFHEEKPLTFTGEFYTKMCKCVEYLECHGYDTASSDGGIVPVYYYLYKYYGDKVWLDKAISALGSQCEKFDLFSGLRFASPITTGLSLLLKELPDHPDTAKWKTFAQHLVTDYFIHLRDDNTFRAMPSLGGKNPAGQWNDMTKEPVGAGNLWGIRHIFTSLIANTALDAIRLIEITGDKSLEKVASGCMGWVFGINPGFPRWAVANPPSDRDLEAAAMIANTPFRHAKAWTEWSFNMMNPDWQSVPNGYIFKEKTVFEYPDQWQSAETFIATDGVLLTSLIEYENYLESGLPAPCSTEQSSLAAPCSGECFDTNQVETTKILTGWWEQGDAGIKLHSEDSAAGYAIIDINERNGILESDVVLYDAGRAGLVCRGRIIVYDHTDELAGYHIVLDADNCEVAVYTRVAQMRKLASTPYPVRSNTPYHMEINLDDEIIRVSVNGETVITVKDELPMQPGHYRGCCGLYSQAGCAGFNQVVWNENQPHQKEDI